MNTQKLFEILSNFAVRPDAYSTRPGANEAFVITKNDHGWIVYYSERGLQTGTMSFSTESEACENLLERISRDSTSRKSSL